VRDTKRNQFPLCRLLISVRLRPIGIICAICLLALFSGRVNAREVTVLSFSFQVPDSWTVQENGGAKLFATAATQANHPPYVLAEGCVPTRQTQCIEEGFHRPFGNDEQGIKATRSLGCYGIKGVAIARKDGVTETRWICSTTVGPDNLQITAGFSFFQIRGAVLRVSYLAGVKDQDVQSFLDAFGRSLKAQ
jgi:hypothetical protein